MFEPIGTSLLGLLFFIAVNVLVIACLSFMILNNKNNNYKFEKNKEYLLVFTNPSTNMSTTYKSMFSGINVQGQHLGTLNSFSVYPEKDFMIFSAAGSILGGGTAIAAGISYDLSMFDNSGTKRIIFKSNVVPLATTSATVFGISL